MRVAIIVLEDFPGGDTRVRRQVAALDQAGHEVVVLCATGYSTEPQWHGARIIRTITARKKAGSMKRRAFEYLCFTVEAWFRMAALAIAWRPAVVQVANMPDFLVAAALPARFLRGSKIVFDLHDLMPELLCSKAGGSALTRKLIDWQERAGIRMADVVMTVNGICARLLNARYGDVHPVVIPNAPDPKTFPRLAPKLGPVQQGAFRIGYHGTVARRFGVATLVKSAALLLARDVPLSVDVWGGGDDLDEVKALAARLGVAPAIRFHGQVKVDTLVAQLPGLDVSVVPYEADPYMGIAYSTKAFELAMMGIPIVASDQPGIREQFSDAAVRYFTPGDEHALAEQLHQLYLHPAQATAQAHAAHEELRRFDWATISAEYLAALGAPAA